MIEILTVFLQRFGIEPTGVVIACVVIAVMIVVWLLTHAVLINVFWSVVRHRNRQNPREWLTILIDSNVFVMFVLMLQWIIINLQIRLWIPEQLNFYGFFEVLSRIFVTLFTLAFAFAVINFVNKFLQRRPFGQRLPINGIAQALKMILSVIFIILIASVLLNRSPVLILSGLGAMTAVLMLIFQDPIRGFAAGVQLSAYNLLAIGDWVEMPKYHADGDVVEVGLTTVRIQNWDKTIVSVPTYAFMSDSFKNWSGMSVSGGRRMKRSVFIDVTSIHFLSDAEIKRLRRASLLSEYLDNKTSELEKFNTGLGVDLTSPVNGRHLTNIGTLRTYLGNYLKANPGIHKDLTCMVRLLEPSPQGLPIEIYAFTSTTAWAEYENIQADIFDHIYAVLPEFGLRAYQSPSGTDIRSLGCLAAIDTDNETRPAN